MFSVIRSDLNKKKIAQSYQKTNLSPIPHLPSGQQRTRYTSIVCASKRWRRAEKQRKQKNSFRKIIQMLVSNTKFGLWLKGKKMEIIQRKLDGYKSSTRNYDSRGCRKHNKRTHMHETIHLRFRIHLLSHTHNKRNPIYPNQYDALQTLRNTNINRCSICPSLIFFSRIVIFLGHHHHLYILLCDEQQHKKKCETKIGTN